MKIKVPLVNTLREGSRNYYSNVLTYKKWNDAHDKKEEITKYLSNVLDGCEVLEIGCGNGKYAKRLYPFVGYYTGIDISRPQLKIASKECNNLILDLFCRSAEKTGFEENKFDAVISIWGAISVVKDLRRKKKRHINE